MTVPAKLFSWDELHSLCLDLADKIRRTDTPVEVIVAIARGGLLPALALSYALDVRDVYAISAATTVNDAPGAEKFPPVIRSNLSPDDIRGRACLLVDDVVDTGATMRAARAAVEALGPSRVTSAAMIWSRLVVNAMGGGVCEADLIGTELDIWASVPWEPAI